MSDRLVQLASFSTSTEAAVVRGLLDVEGIATEFDGEAVASWFWYLGSATGGVKLLVREDDLNRAQQILAHIEPGTLRQDEESGDEEETESSRHEDELPPELARAWRASMIGFAFLPVFLHIYSICLLIRHRRLIGPRPNWRVKAAWVANVTMVCIAIVITWFIWSSQSHLDGYIIDGRGDVYEFKHGTLEELDGKADKDDGKTEPFPIKAEQVEEITIPLVPTP